MADQARDAVSRTRELQDRRERRRELLMAENAAQSVMMLMAQLFEHPIVSAPRAEELLGITYRTASLAIQRMERAEILVEFAGSSHLGRYVAAQGVRDRMARLRDSAGRGATANLAAQLFRMLQAE